MLKKTITYTDYDGNARTEDFYFNLTQAEIIELNMSPMGGLDNTLRKIIKETNTGKIVEMIKHIILMAYGEKSFDGKKFIKKDPATGRKLADDFEESPAFSELFMELLGDEKKAAAFINGIIPKDVKAKMDDPKNQAQITEIKQSYPTL